MAKNLVLAKAQNAIMAHDWVTAARLYKELLQGNESNVDYLKELGNIYVKAGEDEKAIPYYQQIITFYPHYIEAMNSLGAIYRRLKRYEESVNILHRALDEGRDKAAVYYNLGFTYKEMGNFDDAIDAFETVITENPDDVLAYNHLGAIYFTKKEYEKSIASYKRGLQVDPNHPILNYNLARCYEADKNYTEAIRCYEATLKTKPAWTDAIRDFSGLLIKCQENKKAQLLVEKSIKLHPRDVDLLCILGRIFINQFDYDSASQTYKKANALDSNNIKVLVGFSEALEKGDKAAQALDKALEALEIDPYNKDVRKRYVSTLLSNQRYDQAYENVMSLQEETQEKDPQVLDLCAQYYICRGDEVTAKAYHEKIQKVNHHYKDHMLSASDRYVQIGDFDKAESFAKQFVERRSQLPDGYNRLGAIYQAKGDLKSAKENFEKGKKYCEPNVVAEKALQEVNEKLNANPDLYNHETPAAESETVNAEEQLVPPAVMGEIAGEVQEQNQDNSDEEFDYSQLGDNVPMGEALVESEDDFWNEFDDDSESEPVEMADEESVEDEPEETPQPAPAQTMAMPEEDYDSDIFDKLGGSEAEEEANDDEFDFSSLDGVQDKKDSDLVEPSMEEAEESEPEVELNAPEKPVAPEMPVEPNYAKREPEYERPYMPPMPDPQPYYDRQMQSAAMNSADRAMDAAFMAQKMVQQLSDQQKNFEQAMEIKNEKMIQEAVEKAVEQKIQESMDNQMERIMAADDETFEDFGTVEEFIPETNNEEPEVQVEESVVVAVEEDLFLTVDELMGEEAVPVDNPFEEKEDNFVDVSEFAMPEEPEHIEISPEDDFEAVEDFVTDDIAEEKEVAADEPVEEDDFDTVEAFATEEVEEDDFAAVGDFVQNEPAETVVEEENFADVDEFAGEETVPEVSEEDVAPAEEDDFAEVGEFADEAETPVEEDFAVVGDFAEEEAIEAEPAAVEPTEVPDIVEPTEVPAAAEPKNDQLELFKTLRVLSSFLPESEKDSFLSCRIRMMIEYIIASLSGKPGLLITAEALIESGALGEEYNSQLTEDSGEDLSNSMIIHVLKYMKELAENLEDKKLSSALCASADNILERLELENK